VFADHLETVVLWHADAHERVINDTADGLPVAGILAFADIDTNEGHGLFSYCSGKHCPLAREPESYQHMLASASQNLYMLVIGFKA
jgi:hypothetical protein